MAATWSVSVSARGLNRYVRAAVEWCLEAAALNGISPIITSTYRSSSEQTRLYRKNQLELAAGRTPAFPANPPGQSGHQYGLAWDSWVPASQVPLWITIRRHAGFHVPDNDVIHAEVPGWAQYVRR